MDPFSFPPLALLLEGASNALTALAGILSSGAPGWGAAVSVVVVTLAVRALFIPLSIRQVRAQLARLELAPRIVVLRKRHARHPERLQREVAALYADAGVSPFAGMLPVLAQLPIIGLVYAVFTRAEIAGHTNSLLEGTLLGIPLGQAWVPAMGDSIGALGLGLTLFALLIGTAFINRWLSRRWQAEPVAENPALARLGAITPFVTVVFAAFLPLAASIWVVVSGLWGALERSVLLRVLASRPATG